MQIRNINNQLNFNGIHFKNVSPEVRQALLESKVVQQLGENYDCYVSQYTKYTKGDYGKAVEYGLKYNIKEIVPNLFNQKPRFSINGSSDFALNPNEYNSASEMRNVISEDLTNEVSLLDMNFFKQMVK